jgi:hypothetical protein
VDGGENAAKEKGRTPPTRSPKQPLVIFCTLPLGDTFESRFERASPLALDPQVPWITIPTARKIRGNSGLPSSSLPE